MKAKGFKFTRPITIVCTSRPKIFAIAAFRVQVADKMLRAVVCKMQSGGHSSVNEGANGRVYRNMC